MKSSVDAGATIFDDPAVGVDVDAREADCSGVMPWRLVMISVCKRAQPVHQCPESMLSTL